MKAGRVQSNVTQRRDFLPETVAFVFRHVESTNIGIVKTCRERVFSQPERLIRLPTRCFTGMAGGALIVFKQRIAMSLLRGNGFIIAA